MTEDQIQVLNRYDSVRHETGEGLGGRKEGRRGRGENGKRRGEGVRGRDRGEGQLTDVGSL